MMMNCGNGENMDKMMMAMKMSPMMCTDASDVMRMMMSIKVDKNTTGMMMEDGIGNISMMGGDNPMMMMGNGGNMSMMDKQNPMMIMCMNAHDAMVMMMMT